MDLTYSNPRKHVVINDWPYGSLRCQATFVIESKPNKGERAVRVTINPKTNRATAPKQLTYATRVLFVDGSDGRLYVLELSNYGFVSVMKGTFDYQQETIYPSNPRFAEVRALFEAVPSCS